MASEIPTAEVLEYSMVFNIRLVFARTNVHEAHLYKDPMNRWVVMIEEHPTAFDPAPWINYQGEIYMGQEGVRYVMTNDPDNVNKWGQIVEEPPYEYSNELKLLNAIKVKRVPVDDPSLVVYVSQRI